MLLNSIERQVRSAALVLLRLTTIELFEREVRSMVLSAEEPVPALMQGEDVVIRASGEIDYLVETSVLLSIVQFILQSIAHILPSL